MKTKLLYSMALFLAASALIGVRSAGGQCATCTVSQECNPGSSGDHCHIFYFEKEQWCNWHGECLREAVMSPRDLSPAGTYLADQAIESPDGQALVTPCHSFIVAHLASAELAPQMTDEQIVI